jgi:AraC-like DNA-binding protein
MGSIKNTTTTGKEETKVWHSNEFGHIECLRANYVTHSFARHTHDGFAIGVIERGGEVFNYRGKQNRAGRGQVILINPGEVHDGQGAGDDGWAFSIFYADPKVLQRAAMEITGKNVSIPFFKEAVVDDKISSRKLLRLHRTIENSNSILERESLILATFAELISRQSVLVPISAETGREPTAILRAKTYIEENYAENFSLTELASFAQLSRFHLIRVFKKHTGLSPHAYLEQIRVNRAKERLRSGAPIADTAYELGFVDQSHLTKTFKKFAGTTPGQYYGNSR